MDGAMIREKINTVEAAARATALSESPAVRAWIRCARRLFKDLPPDTWIYWQESNMNLMASVPGGGHYVGCDGGCDQSAIIASVNVPGSDSGAW